MLNNYAKVYYTKCYYAKCHYAKCHYAKCHYAKCHYAKYMIMIKTDYETFSTLKVLALPSILIRPLGPYTQVLHLDNLTTFVYIFHFTYLCK